MDYLVFGVIGLALILLIILAVTGLLKNLFIWIGIQVDWAKSFFNDNVTSKPSISSVCKLVVVVSYCYSFVNATNHKGGIIPEISWAWVAFLAAVIGLTQITDLFSKYFNAKTGGTITPTTTTTSATQTTLTETK